MTLKSAAPAKPTEIAEAKIIVPSRDVEASRYRLIENVAVGQVRCASWRPGPEFVRDRRRLIHRGVRHGEATLAGVDGQKVILVGVQKPQLKKAVDLDRDAPKIKVQLAVKRRRRSTKGRHERQVFHSRLHFSFSPKPYSSRLHAH
jgi:hypothetical protein